MAFPILEFLLAHLIKVGRDPDFIFIRPSIRGSRLLGIGTSRTSGSPSRAITTSSPASARSTRRESELFAWCMFTTSAIPDTLI